MYGVDQCRVCGNPIAVKSPTTVEEQEKAIRKPIVPEKVWRARGYLTPPTQSQWLANPADGCCSACGEREMRRKFRHVGRFWILIVGALLLTAIVVAVVDYIPH
jgi:predicted nucleic acid-binding Zn ribbon protein